MGYQSLIYSATIANAAGDGPWTDVGGARGSSWSIHIENWTSGTSVEVSNEIPVPTTPNPNMPSQTRAAYPPYGPPETVTNYGPESHTVTATVTATHAPSAGQTFTDRGVVFATGPQAGQALQFLPTNPGAPGTYSVNQTTGVYSFNATDVANGFNVSLNYTITAPNAGVVLAVGSGYYLPNPPAAGHVLVVAKSDLNVKWVRIRQATPGTTLAFLHIDK